MGKQDMSIIRKALEEAKWLISDEYAAVLDEEIKQKYEEVLEKIESALKEIRGEG